MVHDSTLQQQQQQKSGTASYHLFQGVVLLTFRGKSFMDGACSAMAASILGVKYLRISENHEIFLF